MKKVHVALIFLFAILVGAMVFLLSGETSQYLSFGEAEKKGIDEFKVNGILDTTQPIEYNPSLNANLCTFYLKDKKGVIKKILLKAGKPRDLEKSGPDDEIVIEGRLINNEFHVEKDGIQLKCPSKYNKGKPEA
ncbi:MAG: cytochrome c maturation protein CcmE [Bacteroidota bacterium]|jgi:cytochrome c-type biogenesis protein CcmE